MFIGTGLTIHSGSASGGTPTPPFAFPEGEMLLGMGLNPITPDSGYYPFANILWNASAWEQTSGSGDWSQAWGVLTAASPTDTFRAVIADTIYDNLPAGTYTVLNPDGCEIGIGRYTDQSLAAYTTATQFTFTYANDRMIAIHAKGSVTNNAGPIQIIMPGRLSAFQAGDNFNPDFIAWQQGAGAKIIRPMDQVQSYKDITETWAEVPSTIPMMFAAPTTRLESKVPHQLVVELANRLGAHLWWNTPARADNSFIDGWATYLRDNLDPALRVFSEPPNEVWNTAGPFNDSTEWVRRINFTRYEATPNAGISGWTRADHGLATGDRIAVFFTRENFTKKLFNTQVYPLGWGAGLYVEATDANNFTLYEDVGRTVLVAPEALTVKLIYKKYVEAGKSADLNVNYANMALNIWSRIDAILGRNRSVHVLGTQLSGPSLTAARLAVSGVVAATDVISVAPYSAGDWFVGAVDVSSGQFAPKAWGHNAGTTVRIAVYASGSTPTKAEILAGTGTGYIGHRDIAIAIADRAVYTTGSAITGLSNGTAYEVFSAFTGMYSDTTIAQATVTASASTSTVTMTETYAEMFARLRRHMTVRLPERINPQIAAAGGKKIACYEAGAELFAAGANTPAAVRALASGFSNSPEGGEALDFFYRSLASFGDVVSANQYLDYGSQVGYAIAEGPLDTSDPRYVAYSDFGGLVPKDALPIVADAVPSNINVEPSYPTVVYTFPDAALTYSIYSGDNAGNFAIVGNELRIVNGTGINWAVPTPRNLVIEARSDAGSDYPTVSFATGFSWYAADALFAWNAVTDTDNALMNATVGGNLALLAGAGATVSNDLWEMGGSNLYGSSTALADALDTTKPFLFAVVLDKDDHVAPGKIVAQLGFSGFTLTFEVNASVSTDFRAVLFNSGSVAAKFAATTPGGKHVFWAFWTPNTNGGDPANSLHVGYDQIENVAAKTTKALGVTSTRRLYIGGGDAAAASQMKHGSVVVVNRAGMTVDDALAEVAKLQENDAV